MTKTEFIRMLKRSTAEEAARAISDMDGTARRTYAQSAGALYKQMNRYTGAGNGRARDPEMLDFDAAVVGVLGTARLDDIVALGRMPIPLFTPIDQMYGALDLPWLQEAVEQLLNIEDATALEPLWRNGVCKVPQSDALVHAHFDILQSKLFDEAVLLEVIVWRFFDTEGTRRFSLARHDQASMARWAKGFSDRSAPWAERLLGYMAAGQLDRGRLIAATLSAMHVTGRSSDVTWFAAFFQALAPTSEELAGHRDRLDALSSNDMATKAAFAKRCLRGLT